jgi:hypothetical protein
MRFVQAMAPRPSQATIVPTPASTTSSPRELFVYCARVRAHDPPPCAFVYSSVLACLQSNAADERVSAYGGDCSLAPVVRCRSLACCYCRNQALVYVRTYAVCHTHARKQMPGVRLVAWCAGPVLRLRKQRRHRQGPRVGARVGGPARRMDAPHLPAPVARPGASRFICVSLRCAARADV